MSACAVLYPPVTANDQFKLRYTNTLRWSTLVALLLMILLFLLSPQYVPTPYRPLNPEIIELLPPPPEFEFPEKPKPPPVIPRPIEPVNDPDLQEEDIPPTIGRWDDFPLPPVRKNLPGDGERFTPSATDPQLLGYAEPHYPEIARLAQLEGTVVVNVLVGPDGRVLKAEIQRGVHPMLDQAALDAARKCRFSPGLQRELPVRAWMAIPYRFRLH